MDIVDLFGTLASFFFALLFCYCSRLAIPLHPTEAVQLPTRPRVGHPPTFSLDLLIEARSASHIPTFAAAQAVSLSSVFSPFGVLER